MRKKLIFLFILYFFTILIGTGSTILFSQNPEAIRSTYWHFGNGAGLDFSSGAPISITNGKLHSKEGCATISDLFGNLLFYTDGDTVWDRTNIPMTNGIGLSSFVCGGSSGNSSLQNSLIVPNPANSNQYYLFTTDCGENLGADGFRYNLIDMTLNGGNGDVVSSQKRVLLFAPSTEMNSATLHSNGTDFWIVAHEFNNNNFRVYKADNTGLNIIPTIFSIGLNINDFYSCLKFSPNGKMLGMGFPNIFSVNEIFDFDNTLGGIKHKIYLPSQAYNLTFSPDNSKIYYDESGNYLYVYTLCGNDSATIVNSHDTVAFTSGNSDMLGLQIGLDNKIYISADSYPNLSYISSPNTNYYNFNYMGLSLLNTAREQLPHFMDYYFNQENPCNTIDSSEIFIPNIFTPNNDHVNDSFVIKAYDYKEIDYSIYNRWGCEIIKSINQPIINSTTFIWDGKIDGKDATDGVYYYVINFKKIGDNIKTTTGFIQLIH